ncbi:MAG: thioesterase family protein [Bacteroidales bacterium]|jgi:4-hydroxybenzoyl-CoA thioesterase
MARIKIKTAGNFSFETTVDIQIGDINYGGHLANDAVLRIAHEARIRFLARYGYTEKSIEGESIIMTDAAVIYRSEAHHGDKLLIKTAIEEITSAGFDMIYVITNTASGREVAVVKTGLAFFNYSAGRITRTPEKFKSLMEGKNEVV